jgi:hypothetical protein
MSAAGHFRPIDDVRAASALPPIATESLHCGNKHNGADIVGRCSMSCTPTSNYETASKSLTHKGCQDFMPAPASL